MSSSRCDRRGDLVPDGASSATFHKWKAKYGGLEVSDAKRLKALEDENAKLKKLLAEAKLDKAMLKEIAAKKW
jgi:putative transposase